MTWVFAAYSLVWLGVVLYCVMLTGKTRALAGEVARLEHDMTSKAS